jgi:cation diffusion facilitator CzcD-associated flavoprotein CzcO
VVIVGAGFGGLAAARQLGRADVELTVAVPEALRRAPDA